jgi:hypothetical protein
MGQKLMDPIDPDPEHWLKEKIFSFVLLVIVVEFQSFVGGHVTSCKC